MELSEYLILSKYPKEELHIPSKTFQYKDSNSFELFEAPYSPNIVSTGKNVITVIENGGGFIMYRKNKGLLQNNRGKPGQSRER